MKSFGNRGDNCTLHVIIAADSGALVKMVKMANFVIYFTKINLKKKKGLWGEGWR